MFTAQELTRAVASVNPDRQLFRGVSDHVPHGQLVTVKKAGGGGVVFRLITFNVLNPVYMLYQNGIPPEGESMPSWIKSMDDQAGLEHIPSSDPKKQELRESLIFDAIYSWTNDAEGQPYVICLQECGPALYRRLEAVADQGRFSIETSRAPVEPSFCVTLICNSLSHTRVASQPQAITVALNGYGVAISNVHLDFVTEANVQMVDGLLRWKQSNGLIVAGDFNIQTQDLSPGLVTEGKCTATLVQWADALKIRTGLYAWFAMHPQRFTNWNVRKNCADRERNHDHFDNLLVLTENPGVFSMDPLDIDVIMN